MTENQGDVQGVPPEETEEEPTRREPAEAPKFEAPEGAEDTGRYAAYDTQLGKYVGGTHDTQAKARKAAKDRGVDSDNVEIVEV